MGGDPACALDRPPLSLSFPICPMRLRWEPRRSGLEGLVSFLCRETQCGWRSEAAAQSRSRVAQAPSSPSLPTGLGLLTTSGVTALCSTTLITMATQAFPAEHIHSLGGNCCGDVGPLGSCRSPSAMTHTLTCAHTDMHLPHRFTVILLCFLSCSCYQEPSGHKSSSACAAQCLVFHRGPWIVTLCLSPSVDGELPGGDHRPLSQSDSCHRGDTPLT